MIDVEISNRQKDFEVDRRWFCGLARFALRQQAVRDAQLGLALVDDDAICQLHLRYFGDGRATDVITFPLSGATEPLAGEIVISAETATRCAVDIGWSPWVEAGLYLVHGVLHLCGYDDQSSGAAKRMRVRQEAILGRFLATRPGRNYAGSRRRRAVRMGRFDV